MKIQYLIMFLICGMFAQQGWAPPPGQGGATGGAAAAPDLKSCDLNPSKQTKVKVIGKDGKAQFICTGQAVCGGKTVPVSCKVSEKEQCPTAKLCIVFEPLALPGELDCKKICKEDKINAKVEVTIGGGCGGGTSGNRNVGLLYTGAGPEEIYVRTNARSQNSRSEPWFDYGRYCFKIKKNIIFDTFCNFNYTGGPFWEVTVPFATSKYRTENCPNPLD